MTSFPSASEVSTERFHTNQSTTSQTHKQLTSAVTLETSLLSVSIHHQCRRSGYRLSWNSTSHHIACRLGTGQLAVPTMPRPSTTDAIFIHNKTFLSLHSRDPSSPTGWRDGSFVYFPFSSTTHSAAKSRKELIYQSQTATETNARHNASEGAWNRKINKKQRVPFQSELPWTAARNTRPARTVESIELTNEWSRSHTATCSELVLSLARSQKLSCAGTNISILLSVYKPNGSVKRSTRTYAMLKHMLKNKTNTLAWAD